MYREENLLRHVAMEVKFFDLSKLWPAKMAEKSEKFDMYVFSVQMIALRTKTVAHATLQWPSLPTKFVEIHNFCYHGTVTSHLLSLAKTICRC